MTKFSIAAFYRFVRLNDYEDLRAPLLKKCLSEGIMGTLLLAKEGINGTIAGSNNSINNVLAYIRSDPRLSELVHKESYADQQPFLRMRVRLKEEIVTMGVPGVNPKDTVGTYIKPEDWNDLISNPDVIVIDTRNDYEIRMGTFENAVDFDITSFRDFPEAVAQCDLPKDKPVVMFCTGGIRCEKASVVMLEAGFEDVRQINGGILNYFEKTDGDYWNGECFVFDRRVGVDVNLNETASEMCWACRAPLSVEEQKNSDFIQGASCPYCIGGKT